MNAQKHETVVIDEPDQQQVDSFEDANENFFEATTELEEDDSKHQSANGQTTAATISLEPRESDWDLKGQLEEVRHVLDLALNNQFNRALEMCEPR